MTLRHLKIFVAVCECNGITAAAEKLYLAQPAVSLAISQLEDYYNVKLFDRISRKLCITETGKQLLNYATHIVSLFNEMENSIENWDRTGIMRIGTSISIGNELLPKLINDFKKQYPELKIQVVIDNSENIENKVLLNDIDFGLIEGIIHSEQIKYEKFMDDKLVVVCGHEHPLAAEDEINIQTLKEYDFILREKGSGGRELFDSTIMINNIEIKPIWESISTQAIIKAVKHGIGISILPFLLVREELESGTLKAVKVKDISFDRPFYIIYHKNKYLTDISKAFLKLCKHRDDRHWL
jgi:DNA-binding transcriptional LysR family regulator